MNNVKNALTKKIGPLPAWVWIIFGGVLIWYYRNKLSGSSTLSTSSLTPTDATPPQNPVTLEPGESVYDPNTGGLVTAPGNGAAGDGSGGTTPDQPVQPGQPGATTNNTYNIVEKAAKSKRKVKKKPKPKKTKNKVKKPGQKERARSKTHTRVTKPRAKATSHTKKPRIRIPKFGKTKSASVKTGYHPRYTAQTSEERANSKPKTGATRQVAQQHPHSTHPARPPEAHNTPHQQHNSRSHPPRNRAR